MREKKDLEKENILTDKIFINYFFMMLKRRIFLLKCFLIDKKINKKKQITTTLSDLNS